MKIQWRCESGYVACISGRRTGLRLVANPPRDVARITYPFDVLPLETTFLFFRLLESQVKVAGREVVDVCGACPGRIDPEDARPRPAQPDRPGGAGHDPGVPAASVPEACRTAPHRTAHPTSRSGRRWRRWRRAGQRAA